MGWASESAPAPAQVKASSENRTSITRRRAWDTKCNAFHVYFFVASKWKGLDGDVCLQTSLSGRYGIDSFLLSRISQKTLAIFLNPQVK
jgi:hypothetical protein